MFSMFVLGAVKGQIIQLECSKAWLYAFICTFAYKLAYELRDLSQPE